MNLQGQSITEEEYSLFRTLINQRLGIKLADETFKKEQLERRLGIHMQAVGMTHFLDYYNYLVGEDGRKGLENLFNSVTVTMTKFFREQNQFDLLDNEILCPLRQKTWPKDRRKLRLWSAGCASGEEAYTLAILAYESLGVLGWDIRILASDINTEVLSAAVAGIYRPEDVAPVPSNSLMEHFEKGRHNGKIAFRVKNHLRRIIQFRRLNLLDSQYPIKTKFDMIFCRNVLIYFDKENQSALLKRFRDLLHEDAYLFLGHSEYIEDIAGMRRVKLNVYQKQS